VERIDVDGGLDGGVLVFTRERWWCGRRGVARAMTHTRRGDALERIESELEPVYEQLRSVV
jgi:hypothetical protein